MVKEQDLLLPKVATCKADSRTTLHIRAYDNVRKSYAEDYLPYNPAGHENDGSKS